MDNTFKQEMKKSWNRSASTPTNDFSSPKAVNHFSGWGYRQGIVSSLKTRRQQGFNVVQAVALAEFDGLRTPNASVHIPLRRCTVVQRTS
jgi:ribosomal protein L32E